MEGLKSICKIIVVMSRHKIHEGHAAFKFVPGCFKMKLNIDIKK